MLFFKLTISFLFILAWGKSSLGQDYYKLYPSNEYYKENSFVGMTPDRSLPPRFGDVKGKLPQPLWPARPSAISCYWKAWEIAFSHLKTGTPENGFVSPYIDPAFNGNIFMWDGSFMTMFGRYGSVAFNFQGTLDNFYGKQVPDGFICREIRGSDGSDCFERYEPSSTGPNIMPWVEWEYFLNFNDTARLKRVFAPLLAYYKWFQINRTWQDGSYYLSGWGCGMDNQPRLQPGYDVQWGNGHMSWVDATLQQILSGKILIQMAERLNRSGDVQEVVKEVDYLTQYVNEKMWNEELAFYVDRFRDGSLSKTQTIGSFWSLLADIVPQERLPRYIGALEDTVKFNRPHRLPSLSADNPQYSAGGNYWCGSIWAPTAYMVLRGLTKVGQDSLAYVIGCNHLDNVVKVYEETGTFFENYAPEMARGNDRRDFVGWSGLAPIAVLFEYVFGIRADVPDNRLIWDVRLKDEFGVKQYPFGKDGQIDLLCKSRKSAMQKPRITVKSNVDFTLTLVWEGGSCDIPVKASE